MEQFIKDLQRLLITTDDDNKWAYSTLLMFCEFHNNYLKNPSIIEDVKFIKELYTKYNFGGVQREKDFDIEIPQFISSYFTLLEAIEIFYSFKIKHIDIIELNINYISKNKVKPYKTGLIDFIKYLNLYKDINQFGLMSYFDIINKNKQFFIQLFNYNKDIIQNYSECRENISTYFIHYKDSSLPQLWMIQKLLSAHHFECVEIMMTKLFNNYVYIINSQFIEALLKLFTINIIEQHAKLYKMFLNKFISEYGENDIEDIQLNECKIKESHVEICPNNNDIGIRICDNAPDEYKVDPSVYCTMKINNKFIKNDKFINGFFYYKRI
jgi:hypothetical protein